MKFRNKWRRPMPRESIIQLHVGVSGGSPMLDVPSRVRTKAIAHRLFACDFVDINGKFKLEIATNNTKERSSIKSNQQTILSWVSAVECCWAEEEEKKNSEYGEETSGYVGATAAIAAVAGCQLSLDCVQITWINCHPSVSSMTVAHSDL